MWLRHLVAIALLPFTVAVLVPLWIARRYGIGFGLADSPAGLLIQLAGVAVLAIGVALFLASLRRFAGEGDGTLAPWDPPRRLVVRGPYRYVRNPMISGVLLVLLGEAMVLLSGPHLVWALIVAGANLVYIPLLEEPALHDRFGEDYAEYCRHVPRLLPRLRPWSPDGGDRPGTS